MRAVIKLGGSAITQKSKDEMSVRRKTLDSMSQDIACALEGSKTQIVVVHGAGPFGHVRAKEYGLSTGGGPDRAKGMSLTHQGMERLNYEVVDSLIRRGIDAIAFQPSSCAIMDGGRLKGFDAHIISDMMAMGLVPVLYGDVMIDRSKGVGILSGDQIVPILAKKLKAQRVVIATRYNGIFDRDPEDPLAKHIPVLEDVLKKRPSSGTDVTGGISEKVSELMELAKSGVETQIIGSEKGYLKRALLGEHVGTLLR